MCCGNISNLLHSEIDIHAINIFVRKSGVVCHLSTCYPVEMEIASNSSCTGSNFDIIHGYL